MSTLPWAEAQELVEIARRLRRGDGFCPQCGFTCVDEDGCCTSCGAMAFGNAYIKIADAIDNYFKLAGGKRERMNR